MLISMERAPAFSQSRWTQRRSMLLRKLVIVQCFASRT
jgi:hypothetical protein